MTEKIDIIKKGSYLFFIIENLLSYSLSIIKNNDLGKNIISAKTDLRRNTDNSFQIINETFKYLDNNLKNSQLYTIYKFLNNLVNNFYEYNDFYKFLKSVVYKEIYEFIINNKNKNLEQIEKFLIGLDNFYRLILVYKELGYFTINEILNQIEINNYIVGGFNRDLLNFAIERRFEDKDFNPVILKLNIIKEGIIKDIDIVIDKDITEKLVDKIKTVLKNYPVKIKTINIQGTHKKIIFINIEYQVTDNIKIPYTIEISKIQGKSIIEDAKYRDFTINQIYFNCKNYSLLDFYNGIKDIINKTFNFVDNPVDRINEDPLRILRVYKFMKKGFKPTNQTLAITRKKFKKMFEVDNERLINTFEEIVF